MDSELPSPSKQKRKRIPPGVGFLVVLIVGVCLAFVINVYLLQLYKVPSSSMENTLQVGDYLLSVPLIDNNELPSRGDVVVFTPPVSWGEPEGTTYVKRVVGVGGDTVECCDSDGNVILNGVPLQEPYLKDGLNNSNITYSYTVPEGYVFVLGDNRYNSYDSRYHPADPFIPVQSVLGQPLMVIWPAERWAVL